QQPAGGQPGPYQPPPGFGQRPKKKKTGLVVGLVAGVAVVAGVVAGLGYFVFGWFGSTESGPTLTRPQVEALIASDFMREANGGRTPDLTVDHLSASRLGSLNSCPTLRGYLTDGDQWSGGGISVQRYEKKLSPQAFFDAAGECGPWKYTAEDYASLSVHAKDGGWWITDSTDDSLLIVYGNVWLSFPDRGKDGEDKITSLFQDFRTAVNAAGRTSTTGSPGADVDPANR
ncbi:MAG: hypothetical protein FWD11_10420, partial [Micrococcales bacterium]|nr:hypothetical protein [Micrococcales bacterium]